MIRKGWKRKRYIHPRRGSGSSSSGGGSVNCGGCGVGSGRISFCGSGSGSGSDIGGSCGDTVVVEEEIDLVLDRVLR